MQNDRPFSARRRRSKTAARKIDGIVASVKDIVLADRSMIWNTDLVEGWS